MKYDNLVVCRGLDFDKEADKKKLYDIFKKHHFRKPKIFGVVETLPSKDDKGIIIPNTGGRKDLFLFINNKDIYRFRSWKLTYNMLWWDEICYFKEDTLYPIKWKKKLGLLPK